MKVSGRASEVEAKIDTAAESEKPKAGLSTISNVMNFHHTGKDLYIGNFV